MSTTTEPVPPSIDPAIPPCHHRLGLRVYWEDTDAGGIVFYGNYLKFMERARTEWLRTLGFSQEGMRRSGEGMFVVSDTQLRYLQPARLDDALTVTVTVHEVGRASVLFEQAVWRDATLLCQGRIRIGWVQPVAGAQAGEGAFRPARIPARILAVLPAAMPPAAASPEPVVPARRHPV